MLRFAFSSKTAPAVASHSSSSSRCCCALFLNLTSSSSAAAATTSSASGVSLRHFCSSNSTSDELGPFHRLKAITPMVGQPKPCIRENDWTLRFNLSDKMSVVIKTLLKEENWADAEIEREIDNFFGLKNGAIHRQVDMRTSWNTVEDYQRTPWYRRWRPNERASIPMVSIECMKILEKNLIPPSARHDPYTHLRKRHYEDTFHNERYSEGNVRDLTREKLAPYTKGMNTYGSHSRREFLAFEKEYKKKQPGMSVFQHETYNAWKSSQR